MFYRIKRKSDRSRLEIDRIIETMIKMPPLQRIVYKRRIIKGFTNNELQIALSILGD